MAGSELRGKLESSNVAVEGDDDDDDLWDRWDKMIEMYNDPALVHEECHSSAAGVVHPAMPAEAGDCGARTLSKPKKKGISASTS